MSVIVCRTRLLQPDMLAGAERPALSINPANELLRHKGVGTNLDAFDALLNVFP